MNFTALQSALTFPNLLCHHSEAPKNPTVCLLSEGDHAVEEQNQDESVIALGDLTEEEEE